MTEEGKEYKIEGRPSTIFRTVKCSDNPYVMVDMRPILNEKLSWKAKGILVYLLSRPDGWEVNLVDLTNRSTDGIASVKSGCKELKEAGHLKHAGVRKASGQFDTVIWEVYETPQVGNQLTDEPQVGVDPEVDFPSPQVDYPQVEKPHAVNRTQVLKTLSSNELKNKSALSSKQVSGIEASIVQNRQTTQKDIDSSGASWNGREKVPEPLRELLDVYVRTTGQKCTKDFLMDWIATAQDWLELGVTRSDISAALGIAMDEKKGFNCNRPGSLTRTASMIAGKRHALGGGKIELSWEEKYLKHIQQRA